MLGPISMKLMTPWKPHGWFWKRTVSLVSFLVISLPLETRQNKKTGTDQVIRTSPSQRPLIKERPHKRPNSSVPALPDRRLHERELRLGRRRIASRVEVESAANGGRGGLAGFDFDGGGAGRKGCCEEGEDCGEMHFCGEGDVGVEVWSGIWELGTGNW